MNTATLKLLAEVAWQRELLAALVVYEDARPEHKSEAATHLKQTITSAHSHGALSESEVTDLIRSYDLAGA